MRPPDSGLRFSSAFLSLHAFELFLHTDQDALRKGYEGRHPARWSTARLWQRLGLACILLSALESRFGILHYFGKLNV